MRPASTALAVPCRNSRGKIRKGPRISTHTSSLESPCRTPTPSTCTDAHADIVPCFTHGLYPPSAPCRTRPPTLPNFTQPQLFAASFVCNAVLGAPALSPLGYESPLPPFKIGPRAFMPVTKALSKIVWGSQRNHDPLSTSTIKTTHAEGIGGGGSGRETNFIRPALRRSAHIAQVSATSGKPEYKSE